MALNFRRSRSVVCIASFQVSGSSDGRAKGLSSGPSALDRRASGSGESSAQRGATTGEGEGVLSTDGFELASEMSGCARLCSFSSIQSRGSTDDAGDGASLTPMEMDKSLIIELEDFGDEERSKDGPGASGAFPLAMGAEAVGAGSTMGRVPVTSGIGAVAAVFRRGNSFSINMAFLEIVTSLVSGSHSLHAFAALS